MRVLVPAHDHRDDRALARRLAARGAHLTPAGKHVSSDHLPFAVALLNEQGVTSSEDGP